MSDLFSTARVGKIDSMGVHSTYEKWPALAREGFAAKFELRPKPWKKAFVLAMGGSASGGDIISGWLSDRPGIEVAVFKGPLPVGDMSDALAVACSASGQTEETVQMLKLAVERRATIIAISGGGKVKEVSTRLGVPHIDMPRVVAPRYALPFIVFSTLAVINRGLGLNCESEADGAFRSMEEEGREVSLSVPEESNSAKQLARALLDKTPAIYGARVTRGVGIRFKNVLNENSKKHSHFDGIPDVFHNEIEAWQDPTTDFLPIFLRHSSEVGRDKEREDSMVDMLGRAGKGPVQVRGRGSLSLQQLASMMYRLDMTSYYTAVGLGRDPFPTTLLDALKKGR
jgi:glucose/mannose-6-phosphate isomerase